MTEQHHTAEVIKPAVKAEIHEHAHKAEQGQTPTFVNYVLSSGRNKGQIRPAAVVHDWGNSMLNLIAFTDRSNDFTTGDFGFDGILWATSVRHSDTHEPHTWHEIKTIA